MKSDVEQLRRDVMDNQQQLHEQHENLTAVVNRLCKLLHIFLPTRHTVRDQTDIHALEFIMCMYVLQPHPVQINLMIKVL